MPETFDESAAVEQVKEHLLNGIRGEGVQNLKPSEDALNYAAAYAHIVNTEKVRKETKNVDK